MARVFKKNITRYLDDEERQVPKGTPGARQVCEKSSKWYGRVPDAPRPVPLCANKSAAEQRALHYSGFEKLSPSPSKSLR